MNLKTALKLRAKTVSLRTIEAVLKRAAKTNQRLYFRYANDTRLASTERRARMAERSITARELEDLRGRTRQIILQHRFDIIMHNEGMADRAETETRAV